MTTDALVTPADLAAYQGGDPQALLDQATALVRAWCGWHIAPVRTETITVSPAVPGYLLGLPSTYVTDVASVTDPGGTVLVADTDFTWSTAGYLVRLAAPYWPQYWRGGVQVTLTHGYEATPPEVAAVIMAVASRAQKSPDGVTRAQEGLVVEAYSQTSPGAAGGVALLPHEKDQLRSYRVPPVM